MVRTHKLSTASQSAKTPNPGNSYLAPPSLSQNSGLASLVWINVDVK